MGSINKGIIMCGIAGFCDFTKKSNLKILKNMTDALYHRGPDDAGYFFYQNEYANIGLGHRRLSILDLSNHAHQPMEFDGLVIVYNGEVYNFKEIRSELLKEGYKFFSNSDTEVILKAYHKWGVEAINKFNGMFAIVIYDKKRDKLLLIRDRTGIKPLYFYFKDDLFMFSSELKSFHKSPFFKRDLNFNSIAQFLMYGYILEPNTIFKNTYKLKAGHYLLLDLKNKSLNTIKYWDVIDYYNKPKFQLSEKEAIDELDKLLSSSFEYRMISDVPVGIFLSGGYDSSVVAAILQSKSKNKIKTFTIGFKEEDYNEALYAKEIANFLGTEHTEYYCTQKEALDIIPALPEIYDEPFGDSSAIPTILVSKLARQQVKVSLSADGGDEIFAGYGKYDTIFKYYNFFNVKMPKVLRILLRSILNNVDPKIIPFKDKIYNFETRYIKIKNILNENSISKSLKYTSYLFTFDEVNNLLINKAKEVDSNFDIIVDNLNKLDQILALDYKTYLSDDILVKVDRATMSVSLEGREPLLDYRIIEFVARLPDYFKYRNGDKKWLLKQVAYRYLPKYLLDRPKMGFGVPLIRWLRNDLRFLLEDYLNKDRLEKEAIFNVKEVIDLKDNFLRGKNDNVRKLWNILMFEMWYEKWM